MMSVRLQFVLGSGLSSRLIAWWGQGYGGFSHVDSVLPGGSLIGARSDKIKDILPGVRIRPPDYEHWLRRCVVEIDATAAQALLWERWLRRQMDEPYDKRAILGFILGRRLHDKGHWICSACAAGALEAVYLLHRPPVPTSQITPDALFLLVTAGLGGRIVAHE